jgi:hypothetical protein
VSGLGVASAVAELPRRLPGCGYPRSGHSLPARKRGSGRSGRIPDRVEAPHCSVPLQLKAFVHISNPGAPRRRAGINVGHLQVCASPLSSPWGSPLAEGTSPIGPLTMASRSCALKTSVRAGYCGVPYSRSFPLSRWLGGRREAIEALAQAHAHLGEVDGPGRPLEIGRPVAHAYVLRVVAEFQAFARDLHDCRHTTWRPSR